MAGKSSRDKGARGEREVAGIINEAGFPTRRNLSQTRDGGRDLESWRVGGITFATEVKRTETISLPAWLRQAQEQAGEDDVPNVIFRRNNEDWWAVVPLEVLLELARGYVSCSTE